MSVHAILWISVLVFVRNSTQVSNNCGHTNEFFNGVKCCRLCPKGTHMIKSCNETHGTQCKPCKARRTFMDQSNNSTECKRCTSCHRPQMWGTDCTVVSDRKCQCPKEKYMGQDLSCNRCMTCGPGQYMVKDCTDYSNRRCASCRKVYILPNSKVKATKDHEKSSKGVNYSSHINSKSCTLCTRCVQGQMVLRNCTLTNNSVCGKIKPSTPKTPVPGDNEDGNTLTPTFIAVFVPSILFFLFIVFIVLYFCVCKKGGNPVLIPLCGQTSETILPGRPSTSRENDDRCVDLNPLGTHSTSTHIQLGSPDDDLPVRHLSYEVIEQLASLLNPKRSKNWKALASKLGFSFDRIKVMELEESQATQNVLFEFMTQREGTVRRLHQLLLAINRPDAADTLKPYLGCSPV